MQHDSDSQVFSSSASQASSSPPTTPGSRTEDGELPTYLDLTRMPFSAPGEPSSSNNQFILVIGGLGFIGSHTALELLKSGYNVAIVDNLCNSYERVLAGIEKLAATHCKLSGRAMPLLRFHNIDYCSKAMDFLLESYSELEPATSDLSPDSDSRITYRSRIAGVIHFAAHKAVAESIEKPLQYYSNNVCGLVSLLELLAKHNIRNFVFSSSATVYGSIASIGRPLREEDLVHHPEAYVDDEGNLKVAEPSISGLTSPYARTKYFCEAILADVAFSDPAWRIVALRYFNPIGCDSSGLLGENPRKVPTNLFPVTTQVMCGIRPELEVFGSDWDTRDGTPVRDYIHVSDVARGHIAALNSGSTAPFRTFNLGSGTGTTVMEAVRSLELASSREIPVRWVGRRPGDVGFCVASRERAVRELGWSPRESINKCARDLWNYVQKIEGYGVPA